MLKGIFTIILFILAVMAIIVLMITNAIAKFFKKMRNSMEERRNEENDAYFRRYSQKTGFREQQEKVTFDKDYFDSVDNYGWQKREPEKEAPRSTTTKEGTVIIDHRTPKSPDQKKIFDDGDGEYVEFSEVKE